MRTPDYLSPTSISLWSKDRKEFYRKYLCETRFPKMAQTEPMSVGSAFDAYIKNYLAAALGMAEAKDSLDLDYLLTSQVEEHNRDFAYAAGKYCFDEYIRLGAASELMKDLIKADKVHFEATRSAQVGSLVPLLGKPDLYFFTEDALHIYDWKVNGYCSKSAVSPNKGYIRLLPGGKSHKMVTLMGGMDVANKMEDINDAWALQLCIYGWVLGGLGRRIVAGIDQLACGKVDGGVVPIRVSSYRNTISDQYQDSLWTLCREIWERITLGNIFDEDNAATIEAIETEVKAYVGGSDTEEWYNSMMRSY